MVLLQSSFIFYIYFTNNYLQYLVVLIINDVDL